MIKEVGTFPSDNQEPVSVEMAFSRSFESMSLIWIFEIELTFV